MTRRTARADPGLAGERCHHAARHLAPRLWQEADRAGTPFTLRAKTELTFGVDGVSCRIELPLQPVTTEPPDLEAA